MRVYQFFRNGEPIANVTAVNKKQALLLTGLSENEECYSYDENEEWVNLPEEEQERRLKNSME